MFKLFVEVYKGVFTLVESQNSILKRSTAKSKIVILCSRDMHAWLKAPLFMRDDKEGEITVSFPSQRSSGPFGVIRMEPSITLTGTCSPSKSSESVPFLSLSVPCSQHSSRSSCTLPVLVFLSTVTPCACGRLSYNCWAVLQNQGCFRHRDWIWCGMSEWWQVGDARTRIHLTGFQLLIGTAIQGKSLCSYHPIKTNTIFYSILGLFFSPCAVHVVIER